MHSEDSESDSVSSDSDSVTVISDDSETDDSFESTESSIHSINTSIEMYSEETGYLTLPTSRIETTVNSDSDVATEWDVTDSSLGVPRDESMSTSPMQRLFGRIATLISPRSGRRKT